MLRRIQDMESFFVNFKDVFSADLIEGLHPICGIKHKIDHVPDAHFPNNPANRSNPKHTKEIQTKIYQLMEHGYVCESLSSCAIPTLLLPKSDVSRECVLRISMWITLLLSTDFLF